MIAEEDYIIVSDIHRFAFCRRRWALSFFENAWADNELTISGTLMHEKVHDTGLSEKRGDLIISRAMPIFSREMGLVGQCDVVEFRKNSDGVPLFGRDGLWSPCPVEYKRGKAHAMGNEADWLQLCAQAMCLEEMLVCPPIEVAYIFYGGQKRRKEVELTGDLRSRVQSIVREMRDLIVRRHTPRVKPKKACASCSLKSECLPKMPAFGSVRQYIDKNIGD